LLFENGKAPTIVPVKARTGSNPHKAFFVLGKTQNRALREAVFYRYFMKKTILTIIFAKKRQK
jgi:hypothetical protein